MDLKKENEQRKEFRDILYDLAKSQESLKDAYARSHIYKRLEALYYTESEEKRFRHFYSDIFSVLAKIQQNTELGGIDILGQNLAVIRNGYNPQNTTPDGILIDVSGEIKKLYDHVSLDIAMITYSDSADSKISGESELREVQGKINVLQEEVKRAQEIEKKIVVVENRLANSQKEYVTILGIFAAVVLAFTGGITFSTSVLNNIAQTSVYRIVLVSLIVGLVLINILFGLFYYINSLIKKDGSLCPIVISNCIIIGLILCTIVGWCSGCVEKRNAKIEIGVPKIENKLTLV